jgi:hypothetical protein
LNKSNCIIGLNLFAELEGHNLNKERVFGGAIRAASLGVVETAGAS